jgi:hypothetical protein
MRGHRVRSAFVQHILAHIDAPALHSKASGCGYRQGMSFVNLESPIQPPREN